MAEESLNPIRLGLVGIGRAAGMHRGETGRLTDKFRYVAACDLIESRVVGMCDEHPGCAGYALYEDLLADENVEVVDIATRSVDHFKHAKMALDAGKNVFIEKPMTCTYDEAVKLKALADVSKGNLYVRHNRRFEPAFQHVRDIIESGVLGDVFQIRLTRGGYQRRDDWQTIKEYGGGQLLNWGPHIVDHALRLLGAPVASMWSDLKRVAAVGDAEDHLRINLTGTNKRVVEVTITGGAAIGEPEYLVWGTHGSLTASGNSIRSRYLDPARLPGPLAPNPETPDGGGFGGSEVLHWVETTTTPAPKSGCDVGTSIWEALYATIRNGAPFPITLDEAVGVMKIISDAKKGTEF